MRSDDAPSKGNPIWVKAARLTEALDALAEARAQIDMLLARESTCWRMKRIGELEAELKEVSIMRDDVRVALRRELQEGDVAERLLKAAEGDMNKALSRSAELENERDELRRELQSARDEIASLSVGQCISEHFHNANTKQRHAVAQLIGFASAHGAWDRIAPAMTCATSILKEAEGESAK